MVVFIADQVDGWLCFARRHRFPNSRLSSLDWHSISAHQMGTLRRGTLQSPFHLFLVKPAGIDIVRVKTTT